MKKAAYLFFAMFTFCIMVLALFIYSQTYLAKNVYPYISQINLCQFSFGEGPSADFYYPNRTVCYDIRAITQNDWQSCLLQTTDAQKLSCIVELSKSAGQNFCNQLPLIKDQEQCLSIINQKPSPD